MRGPMVNQILNQFVSLTNWGELDYLIVDMPPGTGDIQLTLAQIMNISAAVIVTTPQRLSFVDVVKGIDLFDTVNIPCIAVVENMAEYSSYNFSSDFFEEIGIKASSIVSAATILSSDPTNAIKSVSKFLKEAIESQRIPLKLFGEGHAHRLREMWGIENIINIPIDGQVSKSGDSGLPFVLSNPNSQIATSMKTLAQNVKSEINRLSLKEDANSNILSYADDLNHLVFNDKKISPFKLRTDCRCAVCVEEFTGKPLLKKELVPQSIKPLTMLPIGRYAISVDWSDGHKSLYPFKQIKNLLV
jgi:MinD-like ATPase involved in chromosome partitioning or flagellar assembly